MHVGGGGAGGADSLLDVAAFVAPDRKQEVERRELGCRRRARRGLHAFAAITWLAHGSSRVSFGRRAATFSGGRPVFIQCSTRRIFSTRILPSISADAIRERMKARRCSSGSSVHGKSGVCTQAPSVLAPA